MKECELYGVERDGKTVRCFACSHKCLIKNGDFGICGVRRNLNSKLYLMVYGKIASMGIDSIEKKPLYHFYPRTKAFSIGTVGCNFKCEGCQNFEISQINKQENFNFNFGEDVDPGEIVKDALSTGCKSIAYTYNEPAIFLEFVKDIAVLARKKGLKNILVTNGYFTKESFDYIAPYIDAMNIDLKSFSNDFYLKYCGSKLAPVLDTIKRAHEKGIWIEITTLIIPGLNDRERDIEKIASFIASIDKNIPWHVTRFFPMYRMTTKQITSKEILEKAYKIGKKYLNDVHMGNV
jgi:pyruvate formate lyase activating enzyme